MKVEVKKVKLPSRDKSFYSVPKYNTRKGISGIEDLVRDRMTEDAAEGKLGEHNNRMKVDVRDGDIVICVLDLIIDWDAHKSYKRGSITNLHESVVMPETLRYEVKLSDVDFELEVVLTRYFRAKYAREVTIDHKFKYQGFHQSYPNWVTKDGVEIIQGEHVLDLDNKFDFENFVKNGAQLILGQGSFDRSRESLENSLAEIHEKCPSEIKFVVSKWSNTKEFVSKKTVNIV